MRISKDLWVLGESSKPRFVDISEVGPGQNLFWAPDFFLKNQRSALILDRLQILTTQKIKAQWRKFYPKASASKPGLDIRWHRAEQRELADQVNQLKFLFQTNILKKAVPIVIDKAESSSPIPLREQLENHLIYFLDALCDLPDSLHPYGWIGEEWMLGATPEVLISKKAGLVKTHALAGTTMDLNYDLLKDPKERLEHQYVIDDIQAELSSFGKVEILETQEKVLPGLKHLMTPIQISNPHGSLIEMAKRLHPTPALGGLPKKKALEWLERQSHSLTRHRFGAPFGYVNEQGEGTFLVAIRNFQLIEDELRLAAGCGIVPQSEITKEWAEVSGKKESIKRIWNCL